MAGSERTRAASVRARLSLTLLGYAGVDVNIDARTKHAVVGACVCATRGRQSATCSGCPMHSFARRYSVLALVDGEFTLKRYRRRGGAVILQAENQA